MCFSSSKESKRHFDSKLELKSAFIILLKNDFITYQSILRLDIQLQILGFHASYFLRVVDYT